MVKKSIKLFCLIALVTIISCEAGVPDVTKYNNNIKISGNVYSSGFCTVYIEAADTDGINSVSVLQDAIVKINDVTLSLVSEFNNRLYFNTSALTISSGDSITLTITHEDLNTITANLLHPPPVTVASLDESETDYLSGTAAEITATFTRVSADIHYVMINFYDLSDNWDYGFGIGTDIYSSWTFDQSDLNQYSGNASKVEFTIYTENRVDIDNCGAGSVLRSESADLTI